MEEKLYTIPVNDAFDQKCECPVCMMRKKLEDDAIAYTLGPSYMEDDVRMETDKNGFCPRHLDVLYHQSNQLGLAIILSTHFAKINSQVEKLSGAAAQPVRTKLFAKKDSAPGNPLTDYLDKLNGSCFICKRVDGTFDRYINTIFYLYRTEEDFRKKFAASNGFCTAHLSLLLREAGSHLHGETLTTFCKTSANIYLENMKRVQGDLEWFVDKFDYRNTNEPWKNSKDAIPRAITKVGSIVYEEDK